MAKIKGPGIFLAQFLRDEEPYNNLENICNWVAGLGFKGVQIPTWDAIGAIARGKPGSGWPAAASGRSPLQHF